MGNEKKNQVSDNFIREYKNQFPDDFCDKLINILEENVKIGRTHKGVSGKNKLNVHKKDSFDLDLIPDIGIEGVDIEVFRELYLYLYEPVIGYVNNYIVNSDGRKNYVSEKEGMATFILLQAPKLKVYRAPHQGFHAWHQDWGLLPVQARRLMAAMIYLNDVEEGGETAFFHQNIKVKPEKGKMVIFPPYFTHMHKGMRPISNDKYICNCYFGINPDI